MRNLKLIWDFRGPTAENTAKHHAAHLKEYMQAEGLPYYKIDYKPVTEMHAIAFVAVEETYMRKIRDDLKPHRGELYEN